MDNQFVVAGLFIYVIYKIYITWVMISNVKMCQRLQHFGKTPTDHQIRSEIGLISETIQYQSGVMEKVTY